MPAARLARKMLKEHVKGTMGTIYPRAAMQKNRRSKTEVIMARPLKSFDDLSLKVVAVRTADNSNFGFEFPASGPQSTPSALTTAREQPAGRGRGPLAQYPGWHNGGIND